MQIGIYLGMTNYGGGGGGASVPLSSIAASGWEGVYSAAMPSDFRTTPEAFTVTSPAYSSAGVLGTTTYQNAIAVRTRQLWPTAPALTATGVAFAREIYADDVVAGVTNSSTLASPSCNVRILTMDHKCVGDSVTVDLLVFDANPIDGKHGACVGVIASDGTTTLAEQFTPNMSILDAAPVSGGVVWGYRCVTDVSGLADNTNITLRIKVYPCFGTAVRDTAAYGGSMTAADSTTWAGFRTQMYHRSTGKFANPVLVYVDSTTGNDTTGVASTTDATAAASPCLTIYGALKKASTLQGNLTGVIVYLNTGAHTLGAAAFANHNQGNYACTIRPAASASPVLTYTGGSLRHNAIVFDSVPLVRSGTAQFTTHSATLFMEVRDCTWNGGAQSARLMGAACLMHLYNIAFSGTLSPALGRGAERFGMIYGCSGMTGTLDPFSLVSCLISGNSSSAISSYVDGEDMTVAFNKMTNMAFGAGEFDAATTFDQSHISYVGNTITCGGATGFPMMRISADSTNNNVSHVYLYANSMYTSGADGSVGRLNIIYHEGTDPTNRHTHIRIAGNIFNTFAIKGDEFKGNAAYIGNLQVNHGVGCHGNIMQYRYPQIEFRQFYVGKGSAEGTTLSARLNPGYAVDGTDYNISLASPAAGVVATRVTPYDFAGTVRPSVADAAGAFVAA